MKHHLVVKNTYILIPNSHKKVNQFLLTKHGTSAITYPIIVSFVVQDARFEIQQQENKEKWIRKGKATWIL